MRQRWRKIGVPIGIAIHFLRGINAPASSVPYVAPMIDLSLLVPATLTILAAPGPTNTLLATSGARRGVKPSLCLIPAELAGYVIAIAAWGLLLNPAAAALPWLKPALRLTCAGYLVWAAYKLWRHTGDMSVDGSVIGARGVFTATLLNPKALLFAAAIFPDAAFRSMTGFLEVNGVFAAVLVPISLAWIAFGTFLTRPGLWLRPWMIQRGAAVMLMLFSASLGVTTLV
jgi:threonine/homoserine/homoserine lactone efflux protein